MTAILGVALRPLKRHEDARGSLTEVLRSDWPEFRGFGQAIVTLNMPRVIRAWHWHERQTDTIVVIQGLAKVPLYDARAGSPTQGVVEEHLLGGSNFAARVVPPGVWHGYQTVSREAAIIPNFPDRLYDATKPDEGRAPHDAAGVPYEWSA